MVEKLKIVVLASTRGSDMQAIIDEIEAGKLNATITVVISDKEDAGALEKARNNHIPDVFLDPTCKSRKEFDEDIEKVINKYGGADLILLIGYMKILSPEFVLKYKDITMNIHPSLLPAYAGGMDLNVHRAVLERGAKITGCSLIFIDEGPDTGPIILQKPVEVADNDTEDTLKDKVQKAEQEIIIKGIRLFMENKLKLEGNRVMILEN